MTPSVTFSVCLPFKTLKRRKWILASCEILDVHSQGKTEQEALDNLKEAVQLFLMSCFERGTLENVLKESGFVLASTGYSPSQKHDNCIDVPLHLLNDGSQHKKIACHA